MNETATPTAVALYAVTDTGPVRAALYRWNEAEGVSLEVLDERWGDLARTTYELGVPVRSPRGAVPRQEGPRFMRALLAQRGATYFYYADESGMA